MNSYRQWMAIQNGLPLWRRLSGWANSNVGWVSDSVTHAGVGFRASTPTYIDSYLIALAYLQMVQKALAVAVEKIAEQVFKAAKAAKFHIVEVILLPTAGIAGGRVPLLCLFPVGTVAIVLAAFRWV